MFSRERRVVRKGSGFPIRIREPPAEGAVTFSTCRLGWVGSMLCLLYFSGLFSDIPYQQASSSSYQCSYSYSYSYSYLPSPPSAFSAGVLTIRTGKPPAEGAVTFSTNLSGWVGSMLCSLLFGLIFSDTPIQLTKAVAENGSGVGTSPLPIHLCALRVLCGSPPHPAR